jgi:hypothetical protein
VYDHYIPHNALYDGLNVFAGYSNIEQGAEYNDCTQHAYGATYAIGGATIGYQHSVDNNPANGGTTDMYTNDAYGVSFAVNDNLTISYATHESERQIEGNTRDVTLEGTSIQASYTVGGASVKFAETSVDNKNYSSGTNRDGRSIALTLAF